MSGVCLQNVSLGISPRRRHLEALKDSRDLAPLSVSPLRIASLPTAIFIAVKFDLFIKVSGVNSGKNWCVHSRVSVLSGIVGDFS